MMRRIRGKWAAVEPALRQVFRAATQRLSLDLQTAVSPDAAGEIRGLSEQVQSLRELLASKDRERSLMLAGLAHEIRNPLASLHLLTNVLAESLSRASPSLEDAQAHLSRMQHALQYLDRMLGDYLSFAKDQAITCAPFSPSQLLSTTADFLSAETLRKQVKLAVSAEEVELEGDASLLTAALLNLLKNAVAASPAGGTVHLTGRKDRGVYLFEVVDHGGGIPTEYGERIFDPFFTSREQGNGLGLPLSRKIAQAHQGTLTVRSQPGETCFQLALPHPTPSADHQVTR